MPSRPYSTTQRTLRHWLHVVVSRLSPHVSRLPRLRWHLVAPALGMAALAVLAAVYLPGAGAAVAPHAVVAPADPRQPASARAGYLLYHAALWPTNAPRPPLPSARGGKRPTAAPTPTPEPLKATTYTVAAGDSVNALAERFGISPETILWANGLKAGQGLQAGGELTILPVSGVLYQVRKGDTLNAIAKACKAEASDIIRANALASADLILIGQPLIIPGGRPAPPPPPRPTPVPLPPVADAGAATGKGAEIIAIAAQFSGYPYVYAGSSPATGFDCSGFSQYVYAQVGISLARSVPGQLANGAAVQRNELLPGDLLFFHDTFRAGLSHVGIYVGGGQFIHASSPERGVCYDSLEAAYWVAHYSGACRAWH